MSNTRCHVCGFDLGYPPWGEDGRTASFDICPCCGCEFGYEDCRESGVVSHRERWAQSGYKWFDPKERPADWNSSEQMKAVPSTLPPGIDRNLSK